MQKVDKRISETSTQLLPFDELWTSFAGLTSCSTWYRK